MILVLNQKSPLSVVRLKLKRIALLALENVEWVIGNENKNDTAAIILSDQYRRACS